VGNARGARRGLVGEDPAMGRGEGKKQAALPSAKETGRLLDQRTNCWGSRGEKGKKNVGKGVRTEGEGTRSVSEKKGAVVH